MPSDQTYRHLLLRAALLWGALLLIALSSPAGAFDLDGMECLDCHVDVTDKRVVHSIISDSSSCSMCHEQSNPDLHNFTPFDADIGGTLCSMCHGEFDGRLAPHLPVEIGDCLACHDPHQAELAALVNRPQEELCFDCHAPFEGKQQPHQPITWGGCSDCHNPHRADQPNLLRAAEPELCFTCHAPFSEGNFGHLPVDIGDCSTCHVPHQSDHRGLLTRSQDDLCFDCHAPFEGKQQPHEPITWGGCSDCHNPHRADQSNLLHAVEPELCFTCHAPFDGSGSSHIPVEMGDCSMCHVPHQSDHKALLTRPQGELCFDCHAPFAGELVHGPISAGNCAGCHDPHAADQQMLLKAAEPEVCFSCHDRRLNAADGRPLAPIKPLFEREDQLHHFPFSDGRCTDCHLPHAGDHARLLNDTYPTGIYAVYSEDTYAFCFNCHDSGAFADLRTARATNFRNGELNLHYRHTNRDKGRTCNACHSGHASTQPHLVRSQFAFGRNLLRQTFTATATGGTCATACHIEVSYDRNNPVNNRLRTTPWE